MAKEVKSLLVEAQEVAENMKPHLAAILKDMQDAITAEQTRLATNQTTPMTISHGEEVHLPFDAGLPDLLKF